MIVRNYIACETCGHIHTIRVSLGGHEVQTHTFNCIGCNEQIIISLDLDFKNASWKFNFIENAKQANQEGSVINLDPDFPIEKEMQHLDGISTRIGQFHKISKKQRELLGYDPSMSLEEAREIIKFCINEKEEWKGLKKCWSLTKNGHDKLAQKKVEEYDKYYKKEPLDNFNDWLFKFCFKIGGKPYNEKFEKIANQLKLAIDNTVEFNKFENYFNKELFSLHQNKYYEIFKEYFIAYDTFNQVHLYTKIGLDIPKDFTLSLFEFDKIKMFYGNCYEVITSSFEILACLNNIISGRAFDTFDKMTLKDYKQIDKSGRHNPFALNADFSCICDCLDNQIRNASHHGSFNNDISSQTIKYRSGKGGTGSEQIINYLDYVILCEKIFCSVSVMVRIELLLNHNYESSTA